MSSRSSWLLRQWRHLKFGGKMVESNSNRFRSPSVFKTVPGPAQITSHDWRTSRDSNPDEQFWRLSCCHYIRDTLILLYGGGWKNRTTWQPPYLTMPTGLQPAIGNNLHNFWPRHQESNLDLFFRRELFYPLNYNEMAGLAGIEPTPSVSKTEMISISPKTQIIWYGHTDSNRGPID